MDNLSFCGLLTVLLHILCLSAVNAQEGPKTPEKYYAVKGSKAELPCVSGTPGERLLWVVEHEDDSLRSRSSTYQDKDDPDLLVKVIEDVQESDAGNFGCSDGLHLSDVELVVIEASPPVEMTAQVTSPDEVMVKWEAPQKNPEAVKGYRIYVSEASGAGPETTFEVMNVRPDGKEEFLLEDMSPGAKYAIQVTALYAEGPAELDGTFEGPRSPRILIETPNFNAPPGRVKAEPWKNETLKVTWQPPKNVDPRGIDGYIVYYEGITKRKPPSGEVVVDSPGPGNQWQAILEGLKVRMKYRIEVAAFTGGARKILGPKSPPVVLRFDGFKPELSIRALPLGPDTVLVTFETIGGGKLDKLRLLYSDDSAIKWDRVKNVKAKDMYAIVTGLQPRSKYYFMAKGRVDKKARDSVTHVLTPPTGLSIPTDVSVSATTDDSVLVVWQHDGRRIPALGFVVLVEKELPDGLFSQHRQKVVFKENEALVDDLRSDERYQVKVVPFDTDGMGFASEPVHFHIAATELKITTPQPQQYPPYFIDEQPERLAANVGEEVKLTCTALGVPFPTVQWFKDGSPVGQPADRVNEITLSRVQSSTVLMCVAENHLGRVSKATRVEVSGISERDRAPPSFVRDLPRIEEVRKGDDVRLRCSATGNPVPTVVWYQDGAPVPSLNRQPGVAEFVDRGVTRPYELKCEARNEYGQVHQIVQVQLIEGPVRPVFAGHFPDKIEKVQGESVSIPCAFTGNPTPTVTWYDGATPLGEPAVYQNTLMLPSVERSTYLRCKAENSAGVSEQHVALIVTPRAPQNLDQSDYSVSIRQIPISPSELQLKWVVDEGNLDDLRMFEVMVLSDRGQTLMRQRMTSDLRSLTLRQLIPNLRYTVNLVTYANNIVVDNSTITVVPTAPDRNPNSPPVLYLEVVEIRDGTARVDFSTAGIDPRELSSFRLRVNDIDAGSLGNTIFDRRMPANAPSISLQRLKPSRQYQVLVDALSRLGVPILSAGAYFRTPVPGGYGTPVSTTSDASPGPDQSTNPPPPVTTTRRYEPPTPRPTRPRITTTTTTTAATRRPPPPTRPPRTTTTTPAYDDEDHSYVMTAQTVNKTPYRIDVRWTVDRGPLDGVKRFMVTIKNDRGQQLLQQDLAANQRSITIQSLRPDTKYFMNVKAIGDDGTLVESDLAVQTLSDDAVQDTSNPILELEANEIRSDTARIDWNVVDGEPDIVTSYRIQVLDGGPGGFNLLTKNVAPNSLSLNLQRLEPNKRYHVIVDALGPGETELMTSSLTFETASPNRYGIPVKASSAETRAIRQPDRVQQAVPTETQDHQEPAIDLQIEDLGESSARLTWSLHDVQAGDLSRFNVLVRNNGPQGAVLLDNQVPLYSQYFTIDGLYDTGNYYIELQAIAPNGGILLSAASPYLPGRSPSPVRVSSRSPGNRLSHSRQPEHLQETPDEDIPAPELDLELNPAGQDQVKVNWTLIGEDIRRPVTRFQIKVNEEDERGYTLLEQELPPNTAFFTVTGLRPQIRYYVRLNALDSYKRIIQYAASPYLVPPPGHTVEPIRTSSVFNKKDEPRQPQPDASHTDPSSNVLAILEARPEGSNAMYLKWFGGGPAANTMVRYAVFKGDVREDQQITFVPAGQDSTIVTGLQPDTVYGFQVAAVTTGGRFVRWSDLVMKRTP